MKEKIVMIRCYQSVLFNGRQETSFSTRHNGNIRAGEITLLPELNCVSITEGDEKVYIPLTNISGIYPVTENIKKKDKKAEVNKENSKKTGIRASQIKRPNQG